MYAEYYLLGGLIAVVSLLPSNPLENRQWGVSSKKRPEAGRLPVHVRASGYLLLCVLASPVKRPLHNKILHNTFDII